MEENNTLHPDNDTVQTGRKNAGKKHRWYLGLIALVLVAGLAFAGGYAASTGSTRIYAAVDAPLRSATDAPEETRAPEATRAPAWAAATDALESSAVPEPTATPAPALATESEVSGKVLSAQEVAKKVMPSVVAITTEQMTTSNYWYGAQVSGGAGSGVVLSADGYIVTNSHVISGADTITVELHDGATYPATVKGVYYDSDLAVIKIDATGLTPVEFADSDAVMQGETVYAVGNPEGTLSSSITKGIVSALDRTIQVSLDVTDSQTQQGNAQQGDDLFGRQDQQQSPEPTTEPQQQDESQSDSGDQYGSDYYNFGGLGDLFNHFFGGSGSYNGSSYSGRDGIQGFDGYSQLYPSTQTVTLHVLQFDAPVSPGNSGGGLFNEYGKLVGIVCAKSNDYYAEGLSFAIEGNRVNRISASLMTTGSYTPTEEEQKEAEAINAPSVTTNKAVLGITVATLDAATAREYGYTSAGVYVIEIDADSTAKAGLAVGDRIISVDDVVVSQTTDITDYLAGKNPGDKVTVNAERAGKMETMSITLIENASAAEN